MVSVRALGVWVDWFRLRDLRSLARSFRLAFRTIADAGTGLACLTVGAALATGLLPVAMSVAMANIIGAAPEVMGVGMDGAGGSRLRVAAVSYVALLAVLGFVQSGVGTASQWLRRELDGRLRERVMALVMRPAGIRHLEDPELKSVVEAARSAAPAGGMSPGAIAAVFPSVLGYRFSLLARIAGLTYLSWPIGLAYLLVTIKTQDEMQKAIWRVAGAGGGIPPAPVAYQLELATSAGPAKETRVFGLESWIGGRYRDGMLAHITGVWSKRKDFTPSLVVILVAAAALHIVALVVMGRAALRGDLGVGELAFAVSAIMGLTPGFNQDDMPMAFASTTIDAIEAAEQIVARPELAARGSSPVGSMPSRTVAFRNVSFGYPGAELPVFHDLDLELRVGERTALVGVNGAGKTTLVKLLCGLYEPTSGSVVVDGSTPLADLDPEEWRRRLAVLFQDFTRYELSALDNIRIGALHAAEGEDVLAGVRRAAADAGVDEPISRLPAGYDSPLAPGYEHGGELSGGQWQRVALARALYAVQHGARVLVLDEPTANLDVRAEAELYSTLLRLTATGDTGGNLLTLLISHRFATVRQADRILVLDGGTITEDGTHDELLAAGGTYAQLFRAQAESYAGTDGAP